MYTDTQTSLSCKVYVHYFLRGYYFIFKMIQKQSERKNVSVPGSGNILEDTLRESTGGI